MSFPRFSARAASIGNAYTLQITQLTYNFRVVHMLISPPFKMCTLLVIALAVSRLSFI